MISVAPPASVAGVSPDQVLLRLPAAPAGNRSLRILARGQAGSAAAIATNIAPRGSLFRSLAPPVGSLLRLERGGRAEALPAHYLPRSGDRLLILVPPPPAPGTVTVTIENKVDGEAVLVSGEGAPRVVGRVKQPLRGIGRYAGTERAGRGQVISWSPTAVLVSTAGRQRRLDANDRPGEERGGFVVQPAEPALRGTTHPDSQLLLAAVPEGGKKLPVSRFFGLSAPLSSGDPMDPRPTQVEIRVDGGEWEPCPDLRGTVGEEQMTEMLKSALGEKRPVKNGITHLRFTFAGANEAAFQRRFRLAVTPASSEVQRGIATITADVMGTGVKFVQFFLNGRQVLLTNQSPYAWRWDTMQVPNGEHLIEIRGMDNNLTVVSSVTTKVIVDN